MSYDPISTLVQALKQGRMVIVTDDPERENEGDLIVSAAHITPEHVNFMMRQACGLICVALPPERCQTLGLPLMVEQGGNALHDTRFTVSIDAKMNVGTGISAFDRVQTLQQLVAPDVSADDFVRPGHIFPLMAHPHGIKGRQGHTEASLELMKRAHLPPAAVIVEIMHENGHAMHGEDLFHFARKFDFPISTVAHLLDS